MAKEVSLKKWLDQPRSLESFGVAGVLETGCRVYYDQIFHTIHLGRISDLILARLKKTHGNAKHVGEAAVRVLMAFGTFEAARLQSDRNEEGNFIRAISIECGHDPQKVALSFSFVLDDGISIDWTRLSSRIQGLMAGTAVVEDELEAGLWAIARECEALLVRYQATTRQIELVSMISLEDRVGLPVSDARKCEIKFVEIGASAEATPDAKEYLQLGDLDYFNLLREDPPSPGSLDSPTGEFFAHLLSVEEFKALVEKMGHGQNVLERLTGSTGVNKAELQAMLDQAGTGDPILEAMARALKSLNLEDSLKAIEQDPKVESKVKEQIAQTTREIKAQKDKLSEMARTMGEAAKKREVEFKVKEAALANNESQLKAELSEKEKAVRHKDIMISKLRDLHQQTRSELEKLKAKVGSGAAAAGNMGSGGLGGSAEVAALHGQYERALKQVEEFKRANQQLLDRLQSSGSAGPSLITKGQENEEIKKRLEASMKMIALSKKQTEQLSEQVETLRKEELKLKGEVLKLQGELDRARGGKAA